MDFLTVKNTPLFLLNLRFSDIDDFRWLHFLCLKCKVIVIILVTTSKTCSITKKMPVNFQSMENLWLRAILADKLSRENSKKTNRRYRIKFLHDEFSIVGIANF